MQVSETPFRLLRAAVFAAVSVSASLLLHLWSGGHAPGPVPLAGAYFAVFGLAYAVGASQRGLISLAPLCLLAQWGLHELFELGAAEALGHAHGAGVSMWLVHVAAALAQASWLARGDAALAALLDLVTLFAARAMRVLGAGALVAVRPKRFLTRARVPRPVSAARTAISRRGPPRLVFP